MTITTIKVSTELRDRLKNLAATEHRTLAEQLEHLIELADREHRFDQMRRAIRRTRPEDLASYREETAYWDAVADTVQGAENTRRSIADE